MAANRKEIADLDQVTKELAEKVNQINNLGGNFIQLVDSMRKQIAEIDARYKDLQTKYNDSSTTIQPQIDSLKNSASVLTGLFTKMSQTLK